MISMISEILRRCLRWTLLLEPRTYLEHDSHTVAHSCLHRELHLRVDMNDWSLIKK